MNPDYDLGLLDDAFEVPVPPSPEVRARARAALLAHAADRALPRRRSRRRARRVAWAAGLAVVAAAGVTVAVDLGGTDAGDGPRSIIPGVPSASAEVLEQAAANAEREPFTPPRDDQWIYTKLRFTSSDGGVPLFRMEWRRADGGGMAMLDEHGRLRVDTLAPEKDPARKRVRGPFDSYKAAAALPPDPDALLRWAYEQTENITGAGSTPDAEVYSIFRGILGGGVLPPDLEAAIFRAMKQIPGVTVSTTDVLGRPALALAFTDDWLRQELLLDAHEYTYRGRRSTVVRDAVINPLKAGNATGEVKKGHVVMAVQVAAGIVDKPGERP
jgi:hypothetical protein